jgi:hexosaminidase
VFTDSISVTLHTIEPETRIHFTLDGSIPSEESPRYEAPVTITDSTVLTARVFKERAVPSESTTAVFKKVGAPSSLRSAPQASD